MFGLFQRTRAQTAPQKRTVLRLEALEWRDVPDGAPGDPTSPPTVPNAAPIIVTFAAAEIANGLFQISGSVADEHPSGLVITFGGATSANGLTVTTAADGTFSRTIQFRVDGSDEGILTAIAVDDHNLTSQTVQMFVAPTA
ncbi:hypothetical protein VT84_12945 [Gemmata sp. SH-PL17]|uniref:hypothetical protein n=1 Tax=Gemmata sp. SH-PL17 TaxID=1630693 RepID=UPI0004B828EB|nr:hypothetical protein [Gemmata sp. SH-PL17]AMV25300.1 hypothetical protein VT84_12945 [Gemmata sp. SH-PL17]